MVWRLALVVELCPLYLGRSTRRPYLKADCYLVSLYYISKTDRTFTTAISLSLSCIDNYISVSLQPAVTYCVLVFVCCGRLSLCGILLSACRVFLPSTLIACPAACSNDRSTCAFVVRDLSFGYLKLKWQAVLW